MRFSFAVDVKQPEVDENDGDEQQFNNDNNNFEPWLW